MEQLGKIANRVVDKLAAGPIGPESIPIFERGQWLALRKSTIGASEAACLFGIHPYLTAYELWAIKSGLIQTDPTETPAMRRGRLLEDDALQVIAEDRPDWKLTPNPMPGGYFFRDDALRISSTPDCFALAPGRPGRGTIQVKSLERSIFRKTWRQEDGTIEPPLHVAVQATIDAKLSGCDWACATAFVVGHGVEAYLVDVPIVEGVWERFKSEAAAFWRGVEGNMPPDPDYARDGETIARIFGAGDGSTIDLTGENELPEKLARDVELRERAAEIKGEREAIKAEITHKLAGATFGSLPGWHISNRPQTRKAYTVKETTFSVLRVKQLEGASP
jgi:YqaJ-like viral recombinase domain